jgi:hypothetical protein
MWFLMRMAFWLGVVSLMLPAAPSQKATSVPQVTRKTLQDTLMPADLAAPGRGPRPRSQTETKGPA